MGVAGLSSWVDEQAAEVAVLAPLGEDTRVLIDGGWFVFYALRQHGARAQAGDYAALDHCFHAAFSNLRAAALVPEVFLDGPATRLKAETVEKRNIDRQRRLEALHLACLDGTNVQAEQLPEPALMYEQLAASTMEAGVRLVQCEGEADVDLALSCASAPRGSCVILGQDSDFFFFRDVIYVRMSDLLISDGGGTVQLCEPRDAKTGVLRVFARLWTRELLSEVSGLPAPRLIDWAVLCGNDHTSSFQLASYGAVVAETLGSEGLTSSRPSPEAIREWLRVHAFDHPDGWLEAAAEPALSRALRFSRALYDLDLGVLDSFPLDSTASRAKPLELIPRAGADLSSIGRAALSELADGGCGRVIARLDGRDSKRTYLLSYQHKALKRIIEGERIRDDKDRRLNSTTIDIGAGVSGSAACRNSPILPSSLAWADVQVAINYQSLCRLLLRAQAMEPEPPKLLFDGPTYYSLCASIQAEEAILAAAAAVNRRILTPAERMVQGVAIGSQRNALTRQPPAQIDPAAYGTTCAAAAAAARLCMQCGWRAEGDRDPGNGSWYGHRCWPELGGEDGDVQYNDDLRLNEDAPQPASQRPPRPRLPVDEYESEILRRIGSHRVSLLAGETGSGKSSRVPAMILGANPHARLMVAQPRRIGAHSLFERARGGEDGELYGLRMGHGVRDEGPRTRCWYVTTGYMVRLVGRAGGGGRAVAALTHIIIDECHERATDSDVLCLLVRRLLSFHPSLKVVLMSATLHVQLLFNYFAATVGLDAIAQPLAVGVRRFPLAELFLEETLEALGAVLPDRLRTAAAKLTRIRLPQHDAKGVRISSEVMNAMVSLAPFVVRLAAATAATDAQLDERGASAGGGAVLIFVPGMAEIEELATSFQGLPQFLFLPIHSQLPFDDQLDALSPAPPGVTKVVAATNAAESSITLPDVDAVIDMGIHKQLVHSSDTGYTVLRREWISKASAQQRAGRTARVRPGTVYRLYPRGLWEELPDFESAQMCREPLEASVLRMRSVVDEMEPISQLMHQMIEPPDASHVADALVGLAAMGFLEPTSSQDERLDEVTVLPSLAARSHIDAAASAIAAEAADAFETTGVEGEGDERGATAQLDAHMRRLALPRNGGGVATHPSGEGMDAVDTAHSENARLGWSAAAIALDTARLTASGRLASGLPLEPQLSRLVALGIRLGLAAEAIVLAASCAQPRSAYRLVSPLVHTDPDEYNALVRTSFKGRLYFDRGMYSEPLSNLAMVTEVENLLRCGVISDASIDQGMARVDVGATHADGVRRGRRRTGHSNATSRDVIDGSRNTTQAVVNGADTMVINDDDATTAVETAAEEPSFSGYGRHIRFTQRVARFCVRHGLAPRQVRQLLSTVASLRKAVHEATSLPLSLLNLNPNQSFPPPGRDGSFRLALLRALLVWASPDVLLVGTAQTAERRQNGPSRPIAPSASGDTIRLSPALSDEMLQSLLPAPFEFQVERRCCDVVHVANASPDSPDRFAAIECTLLANLRFDWVFCHSADDSVTVYVKDEKLAPLRVEIGQCLGIGESQVEHAQGALTFAEVGDRSEETSGASSLAGSSSSSYRFGRCSYARLFVRQLSHSQHAALRHLSSRRGVALEQTVARLHVQRVGEHTYSGSFVCANAPPLCSPPTGASAALTPDSLSLLRGLFGSKMLAKVSPSQAPPVQVIRFRPTPGHAVQPQPPLFPDRAAGIRLLCSMASGYRDKKLRVSASGGISGPSAIAEGAHQPPPLVVQTDAPEGLSWKWLTETHQKRALLDRHCALKSALPPSVGFLCAVGTSAVMLGDGGDVVAIEGPTILPPGVELAALVLEVANRAPLPLASPYGGLMRSQLEHARRLMPLLNDHRVIEPQLHLVAQLRELFEPWLTHRDETAEICTPDDPDSTCPICYTILHDSSMQLPRLQCPTCSKRFHAACLYTWYASEQKKKRSAPNILLCPLCQCVV